MSRQARNWQIGDVIPYEPGRGVQGWPMDEPLWFAFITPPTKESAAQVWLDRRGVESWYPTETRWRRVPRGRVKRVPYQGTVVPRYIFARFTGQPQWDVLRSSRWLSGVVGRHGEPLPITDLTLARMAEVPQRLEVIRERERQRRMIRPGDRVRIRDGVMSGWVVEVRDIHEGIARFLVPLLGERETEIEVTRLEKDQGLA